MMRVKYSRYIWNLAFYYRNKAYLKHWLIVHMVTKFHRDTWWHLLKRDAVTYLVTAPLRGMLSRLVLLPYTNLNTGHCLKIFQVKVLFTVWLLTPSISSSMVDMVNVVSATSGDLTRLLNFFLIITCFMKNAPKDPKKSQSKTQI